jgi:hypothetical protein
LLSLLAQGLSQRRQFRIARCVSPLAGTELRVLASGAIAFLETDHAVRQPGQHRRGSSLQVEATIGTVILLLISSLFIIQPSPLVDSPMQE